MKEDGVKKKRPILKTFLIIISAVCLAALCACGYLYWNMQSMQTEAIKVVEKTPEAQTQTPVPAPSLSPVVGVPEDIDEDHDDAVETQQIAEDPIYDLDTIDENIINILLLGEDTRPGEAGQGRSDTMMLLSYNREKNEASLVSFLRDTYVHIPERNTWNRINAAYRFGGVGLTINTINKNFGLDIQYYIKTDFENLENIVEMLGGLELSITKKEAAYINATMQTNTLPEDEGTYLLNGQQVLVHCRNRKTGDGDWGRTNRQRKVMLAFFNRAKQERDVATLVALANNLMGYVDTNLDAGALIQLGIDSVFSEGFVFKSGAVPFEGTWKYASINGASVIEIDRDKNEKRLHQFLYGDE
ncbi:MAG TPA: LCP family protein [Clostridia bacterium]|nr:LCP family protein [Clostridia bacterium]